jgi:hypothetical protein
MSASDIAKEVVRIANTHGLAKDVIDLLEKKMALLVEENATLSTKVSRLEVENGQLKAQLQNSQAVVGGFAESMGVFWKRTATGFEKIPYCGECAHHPIMTPKWLSKIYICSQGHQAPIYVEPPKLA